MYGNEATPPSPHQPIQENSTTLFCAVTSFEAITGTTYSDQFCVPGRARCAANETHIPERDVCAVP